MLTTTDDTTVAVNALERIAEGFRDAARAEDVAPEAANRFRHLGEELSSHALAAHLLITSGASRESLRTVLERARVILDSEGVEDLPFSPT